MADPTKATEYRKINDELVQVWPETVTDNISVKNYTKPGSTSAIANDDLLNTALGKLEKALDGKQAAGSYVPTSRKVNNKALSADITLNGADIAITGYSKPSSTSALAATDTVNAALGKLEKALDGKQNSGNYAATNHNHGNLTSAGTITNGSNNAIVVTNASGGLATSTITTTELGYLSGTSANIQTQINSINTAIAGGVTIKGTLGTGGTITALPASHTKGDAYYAIAGAPNVNSQPLEPGDMVICVTTGTTANDAHWTVVQNNATTMVGATASAAGAGGFVPAPAAGDQSKVLAGNGTWVTNTGDTHHQAKNVMGASSGATADVTAATTSPYLNLVENGAVRSYVQIKGANSVSVAVDSTAHILTITGPAAATTAPANIGTASSGTSTAYARADHVHALPNTGVTASSYGPSANATPAYGATFNVPYITVDAQGRITAASTKTVKIPASDNTNTTYTLSTNTTSNTITITPSSGSAQTKDLPKWASYGSALPSSADITAMPDGALFLLLGA